MATPSSKKSAFSVEAPRFEASKQTSTPKKTGQTRDEPFDFSPRAGVNLFSVSGGIDRDLALDKAHCLLIGAQAIVRDGIADEQLHGDKCYMVDFAITAAIALYSAAGEEM